MARLAALIPVALTASALALSPTSLPTPQSTVTGEWEAEWSRWSSEWRLHLQIRTRIDGSRMHSGFTVDVAELTGDVPERNTSQRIRVAFELAREAGTFAFQGQQDGREAWGDFTWTASDGYTAAMARLGYDRLELRDQFRLSLHDVTTTYVSALQDRGYRNLRLDDLIRFAIHGASVEYIDAMAAAGYDAIPADDLVRFRIHGVDPDYVAELAELGFAGLSGDDLVRGRIHGVSWEHAAAIADL
ncbi:MAG: hypothetical protein JSW71_14250, partial [Gemmatimonadota bacterium]